jgi:hypothetical protein
MKEHIGRMCDQLSRRKKEEPAKAENAVAFLSIPNKNSEKRLAKLSSSTAKPASFFKKEVRSAAQNAFPKTIDKKKLFSSQSANFQAANPKPHSETQ